MATDDLDELIGRAADGDRDALDQLIRAQLPTLQAFVRLRAGDALAGKESCADIVQSVCREVLVGLHKLEDRSEPAFRHWLFTAALNKIIDRHRHYRREKRDVRREVRGGSPVEDSRGEVSAVINAYATMVTPSRVASAREEMVRIEAAFSRLPEQHREVITLSRLVGLSYAEIGERTGRTTVAVRGLMARGMARLVELLGEPQD